MLISIWSAFLLSLFAHPIVSVVIEEEYDDKLPEQLVTPTDSYFINATHTRLGPIGRNIICLIDRSAMENENSTFHINNFSDGVNMCTHVLFAYAELCGNDTICGLDFDENATDSKALQYGSISDLKTKWPNLRTGISIGGWNEGSEKFSKVTSDLWSRFRFVKNVMSQLKDLNMTAVELAWFAPTIRYGGNPKDRQNYVELMTEFAKAAQKVGVHVGLAIRIIDGDVNSYYDVAALSPHVDWIRLEAHDLHTHNEEFSGFNAPLYGNIGDTKTVAYWIHKVAALSDPRRLLLDVPLYGRTWLLDEEPIPGGPGSPSLGSFTLQPTMRYNKICAMFKSNGTSPWEQKWDALALTPWAISDNSYLSYDNERSLKAKVEFANRQNLAGVAVYTIDQDDYNGECGKGKMPLLKAVKAAVDSLKKIERKTEIKI